jgi:hypothetical protein
VNFGIRYHGDDARVAPALTPLAVEQCSRQEMGADGDIGVEGANLFEQARGFASGPSPQLRPRAHVPRRPRR